jgi:tetratricopeptide (TPR) repeat protein
VSQMRLLAPTVALAAGLAYSGTLAHGFVWDDPILIRDRIHLYTWSELPRLLGSEFFSATTQHTDYYRPVVTLTFFLDLQLWGLNPFGFHLSNVLAHALVSVCVFWLARRLTREAAVAVVSGVVFALHPVHSESVAFISGRTDVLATLFALAALLAYGRWRASSRLWWALLSVTAFALAILSKEVAVVLLALLALWDRLVEGDLRSRRALGLAALRYAPYVAVLAGYLLLRRFALGHMGVGPVHFPWADGGSRLLTGLKMAGWYARIMLVPYPENLYYSIPVDSPPLGHLWWLAVTLLVGLVALSVVAAVRWSAAGFSALWFWIALVPPVGVNLLPVPKAIMAERFLYFPSVGFCLLIGLALRGVLGKIRWGWGMELPVAPSMAAVVMLLSLALATLWRNEAWKDEFRLNTRLVETSPEMPLPHYNLGLTYLRQGNVVLSHLHLQAAAERSPQSAWILASLGFVKTLLGETDEGFRHATRAASLEPTNPVVLGILADVHRERGEPQEAQRLLERSLQLNPHQVAANLNLALILVYRGQIAEAEAAWDRARRINARMRMEDDVYVDRVAAEIQIKRDAGAGRLAWARYVERLRRIADRNRRQQIDLANAERRLAMLDWAATH